ncbi:hypothetical protein [Anaerocolumna xylanovorans]|uniref:Uncharacterized protein n=1 Tax=Anaerocolumna xylanovorans DSM 12503 TaxID=1121345 RepID=A0A1M7XWS2_9FIRM|nr:hypothetical protein [Anaerocolumna xylanovorans]SHO43247.1 hypothetical protein SAMN02745217_00143 [Anaerocolumna xylanovorans DSM 12503]
MKSDQEFLKGIYEKAKEMELSEQEELKESESRKSFLRAIPLRYAVTAAAFFILISVSAFLHSKNKPMEQVTPQPMTIDVRGIDFGDGLQQLFDNATDIIEVKQDNSGEKAYQVVEIYRHSGDEKDILSKITDKLPQLEKTQTAVVFLKKESGSMNVLESFIGSTKEDTYQNDYGEILTKKELLEIK